MKAGSLSDVLGTSAAHGWAALVVSQHRSLVWSGDPSLSQLPAVHHDLGVINDLRQRIASYACVGALFESVPFVKSVTVSMDEPPSWEDAGSNVFLRAEIEFDVGLSSPLKACTDDMREVALEDWLDELGVPSEDLPEIQERLADYEVDIEKFVIRINSGVTPWFDREFWKNHDDSSESFTREGFESALIDGELDSISWACNERSSNIDFSKPRLLWVKDAVARMRAHLDAGMSVNARDVTGVTPLVAAIHYGDAQVVRLLLQAGADVHASTPAGTNAMTAAVLGGDISMVDLLLDAGADISGVAMAPTHILVAGGYVLSEKVGRNVALHEFFDALMDRGLDFSRVMPDGVRFCDALSSYCAPGDEAMIQYLRALRVKLEIVSDFEQVECVAPTRRASSGLGL